MVEMSEINRQLKAIGVNIRYWGRAEIRELQHILISGEQIKGCINGHYEAGFAMLVATDQRLLLVDKKPMYLTTEDIRYDMIAEVDSSHRLLESTICVYTPNKNLTFTAFKQKAVREMASYVQHRVMEFRQQHMMQDMAQSSGTMPQPGVMDNVQLQYQQSKVNPLQFRVTNPYTKVPLMMRRRVGRFYSS